MWPFDRRATIVVAGRACAELWSCGPDGFDAVGDAPVAFESASPLSSLGSALQALFQAAGSHRDGHHVHVVLESAWLPVLGLDLGDALWAQPTLEALLRHRLVQLHGPEHADRDWGLLLDHRAGEAMALGFGLARHVKETVLSAAKATAASIASIQPAFAWSLDRWLATAFCAGAGWWLWQEQDRTMVARLSKGRVSAMNPAAPPVLTALDCRALIARESIRLGAGAADDLAWAGGWRSPHGGPVAGPHRVQFMCLQGERAQTRHGETAA